LVAAAETNGLRLILPLLNYWNDLGGMPLYLKWLGISGGVEEFYQSPLARSAYQTWVKTLLTRLNTRTGRVYTDEPAIMGWELANEPRCEVPGGRELLLDWIDEMSRFVKSLDSNHLVAVGDEGFLQHADTHDDLYDGSHGVDGEAILNIGQIDFGTYHFYPESMKHPPEFLPVWIEDHVGAGQRANKPMLLEEYGIQIDGKTVASTSDRNHWFAKWLTAVQQLGGAGDLLWMLGGITPDTAGFRDAYTVLNADEVPAIRSHAEAMGVITARNAAGSV
jgi:mannan endo-1,4-beta-mannosidase